MCSKSRKRQSERRKNTTQAFVKFSFFFGWENKKFVLKGLSTNVGCPCFLSGELLRTSNQLGLFLPKDPTLEYLP